MDKLETRPMSDTFWNSGIALGDLVGRHGDLQLCMSASQNSNLGMNSNETTSVLLVDELGDILIIDSTVEFSLSSFNCLFLIRNIHTHVCTSTQILQKDSTITNRRDLYPQTD